MELSRSFADTPLETGESKRKEAYRKSYEDALAFKCDITEKVLFGCQKIVKKTHMSDSELTNEETSFGISDNPISAYTYCFMKF